MKKRPGEGDEKRSGICVVQLCWLITEVKDTDWWGHTSSPSFPCRIASICKTLQAFFWPLTHNSRGEDGGDTSDWWVQDKNGHSSAPYRLFPGSHSCKQNTHPDHKQCGITTVPFFMAHMTQSLCFGWVSLIEYCYQTRASPYASIEYNLVLLIIKLVFWSLSPWLLFLSLNWHQIPGIGEKETICYP